MWCALRITNLGTECWECERKFILSFSCLLQQITYAVKLIIPDNRPKASIGSENASNLVVLLPHTSCQNLLKVRI